MIIDAKNMILGRIATVAAKQALLGEDVNVINCELAVVSGKRKHIFGKYKQKENRGDPHHGPYLPKVPKNLVRRTIRGMLPWKQSRGREAYRRVKCYTTVPESLKNEKFESFDKAHVKKITNTSFVTIREICDSLK